ncbi:endocuticle structural glycoprotein SgAbd-5 [Tribolium castaneum]|uniref:Larval cuticle protein 8-like Protein n=1 Tax=Tribolium castaneum TaxID=7070 RepID=D6WMB3_TRICA|nr:PREDICTED: endocuticle structural glycoprotein SgAbd-5 [Tribolium castaneum]EFA04246.1 Larval cuticle protein 8-like Protein [Tribolium castaneum]|eukprot:XP_970596.1 PREDICTED: endocuticle structural glycoprotein SgAbd-5 [Tribolium castaneum]
MKVVIALCVLTLAAAAPQQGGEAQILRFENENIGVDGYKFNFETSDPISRSESGELTNAGSDHEAVVVRGEYTYKGPDGKTHTVSFVADENGYQPHTQTS